MSQTCWPPGLLKARGIFLKHYMLVSAPSPQSPVASGLTLDSLARLTRPSGVCHVCTPRPHLSLHTHPLTSPLSPSPLQCLPVCLRPSATARVRRPGAQCTLPTGLTLAPAWHSAQPTGHSVKTVWNEPEPPCVSTVFFLTVLALTAARCTRCFLPSRGLGDVLKML